MGGKTPLKIAINTPFSSPGCVYVIIFISLRVSSLSKRPSLALLMLQVDCLKMKCPKVTYVWGDLFDGHQTLPSNS